MKCFTFHGVDNDRDEVYNFAKDRDKALSALGPRILDAIVPGLKRSTTTTGPDSGSLDYQHLLASGNQVTTCSFDSPLSNEGRLQYAHDIAVTSKMVEQSKLSPFSFLDHRSIDRLTRASIDLKPRKRNMMSQDRLFYPYMNLKSFDNIVEAAANGLTLHHHVTPETLKMFKEASKLAVPVLTPNTKDESKRVWDKFITY